MADVSCPKCGRLTPRGGFPAWAIMIAILLFPIGLAALATGREPATCGHCRFRWRA